MSGDMSKEDFVKLCERLCKGSEDAVKGSKERSKTLPREVEIKRSKSLSPEIEIIKEIKKNTSTALPSRRSHSTSPFSLIVHQSMLSKSPAHDAVKSPVRDGGKTTALKKSSAGDVIKSHPKQSSAKGYSKKHKRRRLCSPALIACSRSSKSPASHTARSICRAIKSPVKRLLDSPNKRRPGSPTLRWPLSPIRHSRSPLRSSRSPTEKHSRSPTGRRSRSPRGRRSRSPRGRRSRSLSGKRSRSPCGRRSRSPCGRRSRSPCGRRSRSPCRRRFRSSHRTRFRSSHRMRSRSPHRIRSRSPHRIRSKSPHRKHSMSPPRRRSENPPRRLSESPPRRLSESPLGRRSESPLESRTKTSLKRLSECLPDKRSGSPLKRLSVSSLEILSKSPKRHLSPQKKHATSSLKIVESLPLSCSPAESPMAEDLIKTFVDFFKELPNSVNKNMTLSKFKEFMGAHNSKVQDLIDCQLEAKSNVIMHPNVQETLTLQQSLLHNLDVKLQSLLNGSNLPFVNQQPIVPILYPTPYVHKNVPQLSFQNQPHILYQQPHFHSQLPILSPRAPPDIMFENLGNDSDILNQNNVVPSKQSLQQYVNELYAQKFGTSNSDALKACLSTPVQMNSLTEKNVNVKSNTGLPCRNFNFPAIFSKSEDHTEQSGSVPPPNPKVAFGTLPSEISKNTKTEIFNPFLPNSSVQLPDQIFPQVQNSPQFQNLLQFKNSPVPQVQKQSQIQNQQLHFHNQPRIPPPKPNVPPETVFKDMEANISKLFGSNAVDRKKKQGLPKFEVKPEPQKSGSNNTEPSKVNKSISGQTNLFPEKNINLCNEPGPLQKKETQYVKPSLFSTNQHKSIPTDQAISVAPSNAQACFCAVPSETSKGNLLPNESSSSDMNTESASDFGKLPLAQKIAAVLSTVGISDTPSYFQQEVLMKVKAFTQTPLQDITEDEIMSILKIIGYLY